MLVFSSSSILNHYRNGSKITANEASFALEFKKFDPALEKVLFLSQNAGKMGEFSNKAPFTVASAHTISVVQLLYYGDVNAFITERNIKREEILNGCTECIDETGVKYVVVNQEYTEIRPKYEKVFSHGNFSVYLVQESIFPRQ